MEIDVVRQACGAKRHLSSNFPKSTPAKEQRVPYGSFVPIVDLYADRSERLLSADSVEKQRVAGAENASQN
ncbi:hypothetical protein [Yoonia sediminilitoris]|uniref:hypothetical protein n=1 Tax=Yoonia sediminilitoris TaxID=1286148 RepID=UPI000D3A5AD1|nr:hypothetical protein [Yoonia sediminilitoris]